MKICGKCKIPKENEEFYKNKNKEDGLSRICKECQSGYDNKHYQSNKEYYLINSKKSKEKKIKWIREFKLTLKCSKCNENRWYILDFHHLDPNKKDFHIGDFLKHSEKKVLNEIKKCIPLCRNCHSEFHYLEKENNLTIEEYLNNTK